RVVLVAVAIGLPAGLPLARRIPVTPRLGHRLAPRGPARRRDRAPGGRLRRRLVERAGAGIIAGGGVGLTLRGGAIEEAAVRPVDRRETPVAIAVAVAGIAHQEGRRRAGLIVIIAVAA